MKLLFCVHLVRIKFISNDLQHYSPANYMKLYIYNQFFLRKKLGCVSDRAHHPVSSSSSSRYDNTDFPDWLSVSPSIPIIHRSRQVFQLHPVSALS